MEPIIEPKDTCRLAQVVIKNKIANNAAEGQ